MIIRFTVFLCACFLSLNIIAQDSQGFVSVTELVPVPVIKDTGDKPQSKVWSYGCTHWAILPDSKGTHLWRLDGNKWTNVLKLSDVAYKADIKVVNNKAHVLLFRGKDTIYLTSLEYVPGSNTYRPWSRRPEPVGINLDREAYTATIDVDGEGRMWLASDGNSTIEVRWSDPPYSNWSEPITLASGVSNDDISAVIAMPGKVGVLWSNQNSQKFGFKTHVDGADPTQWSADEVPSSQSGADLEMGFANAYINLAVASDGTLYSAVKTEYNSIPRVALLVRRPSGNWDNIYQVSNSGSRPLVILNEEVGRIKVIYTTSLANNNNIVYKESHMSKIAFSPQLMLIDGSYNDATSSKANYTSEAVILASNSTHAVGVLASDGIPPEECPIYFEWQAYPNPFTTKTTIHFTLPEDGAYSVLLYNSRGARVGVVQEGNVMAGEVITVEIDGTDLASGLYYVKLHAKEVEKGLKIVLVK